MNDRFDEGTWYIHINDLNCTGSESSLWDCPMNNLTDYSCYHYDDAAVVCQCRLIYYPLLYITFLQLLMSCILIVQLVKSDWQVESQNMREE